MKAGFIAREDWTGGPEVLVRSETGMKLHIAPCPHIGGGIREADASDRETLELCSWCEKEVGGYGRRYYDSIADAMKAFKTYSGTEKLILAEIGEVEHDQIWIPNSGSYVALGHKGQAVAWFGKTWVMPGKEGPYVELPGYAPGGGGGAEQALSYGETCEIHFVAKSLTGVCEACE